MPWHTVTYKRETVYEQVWAEPIRTVARRDGRPDGALGETRKKLGFLLPGAACSSVKWPKADGICGRDR